MKICFVLALLVVCQPAYAKQLKAEKVAEWCMGNGCLLGAGTGDWHKCRLGEPNVCRQWSVKKPQ